MKPMKILAIANTKRGNAIAKGASCTPKIIFFEALGFFKKVKPINLNE